MVKQFLFLIIFLMVPYCVYAGNPRLVSQELGLYISDNANLKENDTIIQNILIKGIFPSQINNSILMRDILIKTQDDFLTLPMIYVINQIKSVSLKPYDPKAMVGILVKSINKKVLSQDEIEANAKNSSIYEEASQGETK